MAQPVTTRLLMADADLCTGCRLCEVACVLEHEGFCHTGYARLRIYTEEETGVDTPNVCMHCPDAPCEAACPTAALWVDGKGVVQLNAPACDGCGFCARDCPYGAIYFQPS
ncbi:MAG TPA: 4Fe-4S dicluster domain-containing protein, partial [Symbiobacteriaceae bacterium]|nr:4Fe-4S dicluster domain-containing protein [Symbiobacteriaceae bacterium]